MEKLFEKLRVPNFSRTGFGFIFFLLSVSPFQPSVSARESFEPSYDYARIFEYSRQLMSRPAFRDFMGKIFPEALELSEEARQRYGRDSDLEGFSETQFILLLRKNPDFWPVLDQYLQDLENYPLLEAQINEVWFARFRVLHEQKDLLREFRKHNDPLEPLELKTPDGSPAYRNLQLYATHPRRGPNGELIPQDNLIEVWKDFIRAAQDELVINIFDFDLMEIADLLIERHRAGVDLRVGIDNMVIEDKPSARAVHERLREAGVAVYAVDAVGFNHHKLAARDWSRKEGGAVLVSSGNLTRSCLHPEGDMAGHSERPRWSIPNANHTVTLESDLYATLVNHELTKLLDMGLRGRLQIPFSGTYRLQGDSSERSIVIALAPSGALKNINLHLASRVLEQSRGPLSLAQFAFSSRTVEQAIQDYLRREIEEGREIEFSAIGDQPFAMVFWSAFLRMSGWEVEGTGTNRIYRPQENSPWRQLWNDLYDTEAEANQALIDFQARIRTPHGWYGRRTFRDQSGQIHVVNAKLHHKLIRAGDSVILGSANLSLAAKTQVEIMMAIHDSDFAHEIQGMIDWLVEGSSNSVVEEALRRNAAWAPEIDLTEVDLPVERFTESPTTELQRCYEQMARSGRLLSTPLQ